MSIIDADKLLRSYTRRTDALITLATTSGRQAARALIKLLTEADADIGRRLRIWQSRNGGGDMRFTEASYVAYREQIQHVLNAVKIELASIVSGQALPAAATSFRRTTRLLNGLNREFVGIVRPLRIPESLMEQLNGSLIARHQSSIARYGAAMNRKIEEMLARGLVSGRTQGEIVDQIIGIKGFGRSVSLGSVDIQPGMAVRIARRRVPQGLFYRRRAWAWRIVRTEVAEAQNAASMETINEGHREFPDMKKKILAIFDTRTAQDSVYVHGQVRDVDEPFVDGAGRVYLRPPARPNDRETVVPWRERWEETMYSRPRNRPPAY